VQPVELSVLLKELLLKGGAVAKVFHVDLVGKKNNYGS